MAGGPQRGLRAALAPRRGFTLVELVVTLAIAALLVTLALPGYGVWIADNQIRNAAEMVAAGMRYAQAEAVRQNESVQLIVDPTTGTGGWRAQRVSDGLLLQQSHFGEGAAKAAVALIAAGGTVTFTGLGMVSATNADATPVLTQVDITYPAMAAQSRALRVLVGGGRTGIKLCDPSVAATDSRGCPP
jgi:type IV fimbrial biogenesis protein FimT